MKKFFVTVMMIMTLTTAAVSAQATKKVDNTAKIQVQIVKDALAEKNTKKVDIKAKAKAEIDKNVLQNRLHRQLKSGINCFTMKINKYKSRK